VGNPLDPIYDAVAWVVNHVYTLLSPSFGASSGWTFALTIVIIVVLMRLIMVPLFIKQMHTTRAMMKLQPQMTALRKKYKNDKQTLNQEMMKLYQEAGVNPLMGCLPVVLQLPMFFALYSVLKAIADWQPGTVAKYGLQIDLVRNAQHASIFGATVADKFLFSSITPLHAKVVIVIAVVVSMTTTFMSVRQSMKRGMMPSATPDNPMAQSQKMMVYIMPLFALSGLYWPFGLVLYWVTTNMWTLGQQFVLFKLYPYTPPGAAEAAAAAGTAEGKGTPAAGPGATGGSRPRGSAAGKRRGAEAAGNGQAAARSVPLVSQPSANGGGVLRRLGRRAEPAPQPAPEPEVKLVRQQRQRQSRSKRSGKR
jgi:YidC/Oxa1 family membrane protein insertase